MTGLTRTVGVTALALLVAAGLCLTVGCGGTSYEGAERAAVTGSVTLDGAPLPYGNIVFVPAGGNRMASAVIENGAYSIVEEQGPNLGEYTVQISGYAEAPAVGDEEAEDEDADQDAEDAGPQIVPAKYNTATELKETIVSGPNTKDFALTAQ